MSPYKCIILYILSYFCNMKSNEKTYIIISSQSSSGTREGAPLVNMLVPKSESLDIWNPDDRQGETTLEGCPLISIGIL